MRDVIDDLEAWWRGRHATVAMAFRRRHPELTAPRPPSAAMLVEPDETVVGSVSGGCVEARTLEARPSDFGSSSQPVLQRYGVSDDDAFAVGLTCGGKIELFVEAVDRHRFPELGAMAQDIPATATLRRAGRRRRRRPVTLGRHLVVRIGHTNGSLGSSRLDDAVRDDAEGMLVQGRTGILRYGLDGRRAARTSCRSSSRASHPVRA